MVHVNLKYTGRGGSWHARRSKSIGVGTGTPTGDDGEAQARRVIINVSEMDALRAALGAEYGCFNDLLDALFERYPIEYLQAYPSRLPDVQIIVPEGDVYRFESRKWRVNLRNRSGE